eukprot:8334701-Heterocapsa_arctica.AAC.1
MPSWKVVGDTRTDIAIAYNPATGAVKHGGILSIKLYDVVEHDFKRKWRRYLQAALPLPALLSPPPPTYRSPPRVYHYVAIFSKLLRSARQCPFGAAL